MEACWVGSDVDGMEEECGTRVKCRILVVVVLCRRKDEGEVSLFGVGDGDAEVQVETRGGCEIVTRGVDELCVVADGYEILVSGRDSVRLDCAAWETVDMVEESWIGEFQMGVREAF